MPRVNQLGSGLAPGLLGTQRMPLSPPSLPAHTAGKEQGGGGELAFVLVLLSTQTLNLVLPHASELLQGKEFLCSCPRRAVKAGRVERDLGSPNSMLVSAHKAHASEGERVTLPVSLMSRGAWASEICRAESSVSYLREGLSFSPRFFFTTFLSPFLFPFPFFLPHSHATLFFCTHSW